jgi:Plant mobile domain
LISAIIERWRRETHTFHLPVGEMTVTLEDVSCLWGLPINGYLVIGFADDNWEEDVLQAFGRLKWASFRRPSGTYHMSTNWLCESWVPARENKNENDISHPRARLPDNVGAQEVGYYARAYMMDLFSSVMFSDHSGYIQTMYL